MNIKVRSKRIEKRFYIDNEFLNGYAHKVGWKGQIVYMALCRHEKNGTAFPGLRHLAKELGVSVATIQRGIKELLKWNIIQIEKPEQRNFPYIYWLIDYTEWKKMKNKKDWFNQSRVSLQKHPVYHHRNTPVSVVARNNTNNNNTNNISTNSDSKNRSLKRKDFKVSYDIYKELIDAYQQYKGIKLKGAEFGEVKRAIKTILYSGRTKEDILNFMKFCYRVCEELKNGNTEVEKEFGWLRNWTILTIRRKMPEFLAGRYQIEKKKFPYPSYEEVMKGRL